MKNLTLFAAFALATGCATSAASLPGPVQTPATAVGGTPCDPPLVVPASIIASVRAQFEAPGTPRPPVTPEDMAAYQKMQADQREKDWAALCYFRVESAASQANPSLPTASSSWAIQSRSSGALQSQQTLDQHA